MNTNQLSLAKKALITRKPYFVGFNTVNQLSPPYSLTNIDLVKRDLENHFATPMGARLMMPTFGTRIHEMLFDPFDEYTKNAILEDAIRVVKSDPRVSLVDIDVSEDDHALNIEMILLFQPEAVTESLFVSFSRDGKESF